jgi:DnaA family protein
MQQLPLGIRLNDRAVFETFWPAGNEQALAHLKQVADGSVAGVATWLAGAPASGRSHLLLATCAAQPRGAAGCLPLTQLESLGPESLEGLSRLACVCLDDVQIVAGQLPWERALFSLYREIEERGGRLVISAPYPPTQLTWALPDLASRLAAATVFQLRALDEAGQREALMLRARVRGFELAPHIARWLQHRYRRDMGTLYRLLDTLDTAALAAQRRITVPFIRSVLPRVD